MKTSQKIATIMVTAVIAAVLLFGNLVQAQQAKAKPWPVPDKDKALKAPAKADVATGKELWAKHCKSCHGSKGLGDGPKAANLKTHPGDFSSAAFQAFTDGELFYRTDKGRDEMPGYEKKIPEASDRWALVAFMRTFKK
jgi:mono/diheme cytochrome c family protein